MLTNTLNFSLSLSRRIPSLKIGDNAWSPKENNYNNFLTYDLGGRYEVRSVATRGRSGTREYVTEYIVQFSDDGEGWRSFAGDQGVEQVHLFCFTLQNEFRNVFMKIKGLIYCDLESSRY